MASNFKNAGGTVGQTDDATANIYTCPASTSAVLHAIYLSNTSLTNVGRVDIKVTIDGGSTFYHIGKYLEVMAQNTLVLDKPVNLETGDIIRVVADVNHIESFLSILEVT